MLNALLCIRQVFRVKLKGHPFNRLAQTLNDFRFEAFNIYLDEYGNAVDLNELVQSCSLHMLGSDPIHAYESFCAFDGLEPSRTRRRTSAMRTQSHYHRIVIVCHSLSYDRDPSADLSRKPSGQVFNAVALGLDGNHPATQVQEHF